MAVVSQELDRLIEVLERLLAEARDLRGVVTLLDAATARARLRGLRARAAAGCESPRHPGARFEV